MASSKLADIIDTTLEELRVAADGHIHDKPASNDGVGRSENAAGRRLLYCGAAGALVVQVAGAGLAMLSHFIVARLLGADEYGAFALGLTWVSILSVFALVGQDTSVVKFVPTYNHQGDWARISGLSRGTSAMVLASSIVLALIGSVVVYMMPQRLGPLLQRTMWAAFLMLPVVTQLQLSGALHRALKRPVSSGIFNGVLRPLLLIATLLGVAFLAGDSLSAPRALLISAGAALMALVASTFLLGRVWPPDARAVRPVYEWRTWTTVGLQLSLLSMIIVAGNRLDVLILGGLAGTGQVGPYYAAVQMAAFALYALNATNVVLAPLIAERYSARDSLGLQYIARRASRLGFGVALMVALFFALAGRWMLGLVGPEFPAAYGALLALLSGYCISTSFGEVGFLMAMTDYQKPAAIFVGLGVVINCVASYLLIPVLGMLGAAIGAALSMIVWRGLALRFVITRMNINPAVFGSSRWTDLS